MRLNVLPGLSGTYLETGCGIHAESVRKLAVRESKRAETSHFDHVDFGELRVLDNSPSLPMSIEVVISSRPKKEMVRVDASADIALVEDAKSLWDRAIVVLEACAVSEHAGPSRDADLPISGTMSGSLPNPATTGTVTFGELLAEPCKERFVVQNSHVNLLIRLAGPRVLPAPRGHLNSMNYTNNPVDMGVFPHVSY